MGKWESYQNNILSVQRLHKISGFHKSLNMHVNANHLVTFSKQVAPKKEVVVRILTVDGKP